MSNSSKNNFNLVVVPWLICGIGALFYCYAYFLRVSPSTMMHDLMSQFHIGAGEFGVLAAFYYYAYTAMQLPVGVIVDKFGARLSLTLACLCCVVGVFMFVEAGPNALYMAKIGRFVMGFGSAFAYVTVLKLATLWLPTNRFATATGLTTGLGMVAAMFSEKLLTSFVAEVGYKSALNIALVAGVVLAVIIVALVRNKPKHPREGVIVANPMSFHELGSHLKGIIVNPQMWLIGLIGCLLYIPSSVFLDLWGIPYLEKVYHLTGSEAASVCAWMFAGWIIASPLAGMFSDKLRLRRFPMILFAVIATIFMLIVFYVRPDISINVLFAIFFIIGFFCGSHPICFSLGRENNHNDISGTSVAFTNTLIMLGGVVFQPVVGYLLQYHAGHVAGHAAYSVADFTYALSIVPLGMVAAVILLFFVKETHCKLIED